MADERKPSEPTDTPLQEYRGKRRFARSPEPPGNPPQNQPQLNMSPASSAAAPDPSPRPEDSGPPVPRLLYVIHKHDARRLHYDFRLELEGVLKSWAVPKGPCLDPSQKRLAVHVEDHPIEYGQFEGTIPAGEYGGGTVMLWDRGWWEPMGDAAASYAAGTMRFRLYGQKLQGDWKLVRFRGRSDEGDNWLLIKSKDDHARTLAMFDILKEAPDSVATGRSLEQIARGVPAS